jgi:hypothetical protein
MYGIHAIMVVIIVYVEMCMMTARNFAENRKFASGKHHQKGETTNTKGEDINRIGRRDTTT